jgi:hypothetical protein
MLRTLALLACLAVSVSCFAATGPGRGYAQVPPGAFSVVAEVRAKPGREAELRAITLPLIALVRGDPKNLVYFLQEDRATPGHFVFLKCSPMSRTSRHTTTCRTLKNGSRSYLS